MQCMLAIYSFFLCACLIISKIIIFASFFKFDLLFIYDLFVLSFLLFATRFVLFLLFLLFLFLFLFTSTVNLLLQFILANRNMFVLIHTYGSEEHIFVNYNRLFDFLSIWSELYS